MRTHKVRALLMGGQACVFYGASESSRDTDFAILADAPNLARLERVLMELRAGPIAVPPLALEYLRKGHAIRFRFQHPDALGLRVDLMSKMRGVAAFPTLWRRRTTFEVPGGPVCDLLALPDLVQARKTQRDKDWPVLRRLLESHWFQNREEPTPVRVRFWFRELRTPELLVDLAASYPAVCRRLIAKRPLLGSAVSGRLGELERALAEEEAAERERDRLYWLPLRRELERLRPAR